jgi:hypothetical protein
MISDDKIDIGLGCAARVQISRDLLQPSQSGAEWEDEVDYIRLKIEVYLPTTPSGNTLAAPLQAPDVWCGGESLSGNWGRAYTYYTPATRYVVFYVAAPTLSAAKALADAWVAEVIAVLRGVTSARAARLALRERRIQEGMET